MKKVFEVALTGSRFSGKDSVARHFRRIGVPVFDADTVLKFILNHRSYIDDSVKSNIGSHIYTNGFLDSHKIKSDSEFDKLLDIVEFELFEAFDFFKTRNDKSYVIFMSSLIYERNYDTKFDYVVNVFAPKGIRLSRAKEAISGGYITYVDLLKNEIPELEKNDKSDFVIHSYPNGPILSKQVSDIDKKIIDKILN